jgi:hypothetical protein
VPGVLYSTYDTEASGSGAASLAQATLAGVTGKMTYVAGICVTGVGATGAAVVTATLTGLPSALSFIIAVPAGVTTSIVPLIINFPRPLPASALAVAIQLSVPSFGAGNTNVIASIWGFQE